MFQLELHIPLTVVAAAASLTHQPELAFFDGHHDGFRKVYSVCIVWEVSHVPQLHLLLLYYHHCALKSLNRWFVYDVMFVTMPNRLRENIWLKMTPFLCRPS